jgi:thiamine-monophosphate kinase
VGGELSTAPAIVVTVTVVGHMPTGAGAVLRSGAAPGEAIFVTGTLGGAAAGLRKLREGAGHPDPDGVVDRHRRPLARLEEGAAARVAGATAMIDISDGTAADLRRVAEASGIGVRIDSVPVHEGATEHDALCGGDDYELLFTARDAGRVREVFASCGLRAPFEIGRSTDMSEGVRFKDSELPLCGYEHPWEIPRRAV